MTSAAISSGTLAASAVDPAGSELMLMTFEQFLAWHPEDGRRFELMGGVPQEMPNPIGPNEDVCGYELSRYHAGDAIVSQVLPELKLSVDDVFAVAE